MIRVAHKQADAAAVSAELAHAEARVAREEADAIKQAEADRRARGALNRAWRAWRGRD